MQSFSFISLTASEEKILIFFRKFTLYVAMATNQIQDLDKIHMNRRRLLKKHFCKIKSKYLQRDSKNCLHFSHYKSMEIISCHNNQISYPIGIKTQLFVPPAYRCYMGSLKKKVLKCDTGHYGNVSVFVR